MKKCALILCICGFAWVSQAQQAGQPTPRPALPAGPLLATMPDFAQWAITINGLGVPVAPTPDASPTPTPARADKPVVGFDDRLVTITKTKPIYFEQTVTATGKTTERWAVSDLQVTSFGTGMPVVSFGGSAPPRGTRQQRMGPRAASTSGGKDSASADYSKGDFAGFEWISAGNFEGVEKVSGHDCLVFRDKFRVEGKVVEATRPLMSVACIDADTRLPVALQLGDETRTYEYKSPPTTMLTPPPDVQAVVDQWHRALRQAALPPAKP